MDAAKERAILEARQDRRKKRRNAKRDQVRQVGCPTCLVDPGHPCRSDAGNLRVHNHRERHDLALTQGIIKKGEWW